MNFTRKKLVIAAGTSLAAVTLGGVAFAYWSSNGSGTGSATTRSSDTSISMTQTSHPTNIAPGVDAQELSGTFSTGNDQPVYVNYVHAAVTGTHRMVLGAPVTESGCTAADFTVVQPARLNKQVVSGDTWGVGSGSIAFNTTTADQNACKDVIVDLSYTTSATA